jgi:hypothetical protein
VASVSLFLFIIYILSPSRFTSSTENDMSRSISVPPGFPRPCYGKEKEKSSGDTAFPFLRPFWI